MPNAKALIVDDLPTNLQIVRGLLKSYGMHVDTAASGREAVDKVKTEDYDIIFIDHMMPEMDGVETLAALRKIEANASPTKLMRPIIALTANALHGMREFYLEQGFQDYLLKPIDPQELDEKINKWIKTNNIEKRIVKNEEGTKSNVNIAVELDAQRLDMLKHYRVSFENIREEDYQLKFDTAYFERFTALVESLSLTDGVEEQAALLAEAGRRGDARTIRETLPAFCEAIAGIRKRREEKRNAGSFDPHEILPRLKTALLAGETESAEAIIREMGAAKLSSAGRELYIKLYELLLTGETEKALEVIDLKLINEEHYD